MRRHSFRLVTLLLFLAPAASFAQVADHSARLKEIDEYATKAMQDWKVPGFAMAIVKDDKVIFAKGYGVRELGRPEPVDDHTLFAIASNSKAFTAAALAILVDEGKVRWDDKVTKYLPGFQLYDPYATRELTVRDLVSHRSGLNTFGGDLLWYESTYGRDEILRRIRYLKPTFSFRSHYGYQNIMFLAAGQVVAAVTGRSWDDFVKEHFFSPLGMTSTNTTVKAFKPGDNVATPHNEAGEKLHPISYDNVDNVGPAAAINSCVADLAQWMRLQLGRGAYQGKRIFSAAQSHEMWQPNIFIPISEGAAKFNPTRHFNAYGMGWFLSDYHGRKVVSHGGGLDGMISQTALMPEENLGVVVLSNSETSLPTALVNKVFDVFLDVPKRDWSAEMLARTNAGKAATKAAEQKTEQERAKETKPSLALQRYAGTYQSEMYGEAKITEENGRLVLRLIPAPNFVGDLEHWQYDTFRLQWRESVRYPFPKGFVTFTLNAKGQIDEMKIDCPNPDFDFTELEFRRAPDSAGPRLSSR
ncbi:MAG TPA: serine hydrolase [Blastocatellia bacterium]|nr:serine hydrolase [Blastocatellia bacterium]